MDRNLMIKNARVSYNLFIETKYGKSILSQLYLH